MEYKFFELKNGIQIGLTRIGSSDMATILLAVKAGSKRDPKGKNGTAHFVEHMLFKGTKSRPALTQIEKEIEDLGGTINGATVKEFTWFYVKVLKEDIKSAIDVLQDMLSNSLFLEEEIEKEKQVIVEEISMDQDSQEDLAEDLLEKCLYGKQALGNTITGSEKSVRKLTKDDIYGFYNKNYTGQNIVISVAGGVDFAETFDILKSSFESIPAGEKLPVLKIKEDQSEPKFILQKKRSQQVQIAFGVRAYPINREDHHIVKLIAILLGGSMSARLFKRLREELGIVYDVDSMSESMKEAGYLGIYTGLEKGSILKAVEEIMKELFRLKNEDLEEGELENLKAQTIKKKTILYEDSYFTAMDLAKRLIFEKDYKTLPEYGEKIKKITVADIRRVANEIFKSQNINFVLVGKIKSEDMEKIKKQLIF